MRKISDGVWSAEVEPLEGSFSPGTFCCLVVDEWGWEVIFKLSDIANKRGKAEGLKFSCPFCGKEMSLEDPKTDRKESPKPGDMIKVTVKDNLMKKMDEIEKK